MGNVSGTGRVLMKGNEAFAEAAIRAGCEAYFGYPITPQNELLEHFSKRMVEEDRVFLQAESELGAINMVYGAACANARVMTSSSSPGISLMQEGFSYIATSEIPAVIVNIMRGGPGLGNIQPSQGDYWQATKMAGHGDYRMICLAPSTIQEAMDHVALAFDLADKYRSLTMVLGDGALAQMMEPCVLPPIRPLRKAEDRAPWALTGAKDRPHNVITSLYLGDKNLEAVNLRLQAKLREIEANEVRWEELETEDAEYLLVAFGTVGRVCKTVVREAREQGIKLGLLRPVTVWPFPSARLAELSSQVKGMLTVEMNAGQMVEDVQLAIAERCPVRFYGRMGGFIPVPDEILPEVNKMVAAIAGEEK
jgi:2-oxoglutarate/2-oxoacid ferredoxin oxidoreductase subunit alpha